MPQVTVQVPTIRPIYATFLFIALVILIIFNSLTVWLYNVGTFGGSAGTASTIRYASIAILTLSTLGIIVLAYSLYRSRREGALASVGARVGTLIGGTPLVVTGQ